MNRVKWLVIVFEVLEVGGGWRVVKGRGDREEEERRFGFGN